MGAWNQVGVGLSYRLASLCSLATQFQTRFLELIPRPIAGLQFSTLFLIKNHAKHVIIILLYTADALLTVLRPPVAELRLSLDTVLHRRLWS
jgi:hypothetical protein